MSQQSITQDGWVNLEKYPNMDVYIHKENRVSILIRNEIIGQTISLSDFNFNYKHVHFLFSDESNFFTRFVVDDPYIDYDTNTFGVGTLYDKTDIGFCIIKSIGYFGKVYRKNTDVNNSYLLHILKYKNFHIKSKLYLQGISI